MRKRYEGRGSSGVRGTWKKPQSGDAVSRACEPGATIDWRRKACDEGVSMMTACVVASEARLGWLPSHIISSSFFNIRLCNGRSSGPLHFRADDVVKGSRSVRSCHDADRGRSSTVAETEEAPVGRGASAGNRHYNPRECEYAGPVTGRPGRVIFSHFRTHMHSRRPRRV